MRDRWFKCKLKPPKKQPLHPTFIWIAPQNHTNFKDNTERRLFSRALDTAVEYHDSTFSLRLRKVWDIKDPTLFKSRDNKYTSAGYTAYWNAVDKAVKFADTLLMKKELSKFDKKQNNSKDQQQHSGHQHHDKYQWRQN